jgi:dihydrofolate synthase/folylpolyglutamate synthase
MNYTEAIRFIENVKPGKSPYDLGRMSAFMALTKNIQDTFPTIHVAGTNGKGSTVAMLDSILRAMGLKVGRFTGPHILNWNERFHIDGQAISDNEFLELFEETFQLAKHFESKNPQYGHTIKFEYLTAMAFLLFAKHKVDIAIIEVGLGGRLDPTNVLSKPLACAITTIDLDHTHILGKTIKEIAFDKAGIIKNNVPVFIGASMEAVKEITIVAKSKNAPLWHCSPPDGDIFDLSVFQQAQQFSALSGSFQISNSLIAYTLLSFLAEEKKIPPLNLEILSRGFSDVYWPGRMQYIASHNLILDVAHNASGAKALRKSLDELFPEHSFIFVFAAFESKNYTEMISNLLSEKDMFFVSGMENERPSHSSQQLVDFVQSINGKAYGFSNVKQALENAFAHRKNNEIIVTTGSFIAVAETMKFLHWQRVEDGLASELISRLVPA